MSKGTFKVSLVNRQKRKRRGGIMTPEFRRSVDEAYRDFFERRNMSVPDGTLQFGAFERAENKAKRERRTQ